MSTIFYTPQISMPNNIRFADCLPVVYSTDQQILLTYIVGGYSIRSAWSEYLKGPTPPPFYIETTINNNIANYSIYFNNFTASNCSNFGCDLQCLTQSVNIVGSTGNQVSFNYCQNNQAPSYHFQVSFTSDTAKEATPLEFNFTFTDALGNIKEIDLNSISYIKPLNPNVVSINDSTNKPTVFVGLLPLTINHTPISSDVKSFKIEKSFNSNKTNHQYLVNTESISQQYHNGIFKDFEVQTDNIYSYRVKFINSYKEESQWSNWTTVTI